MRTIIMCLICIFVVCLHLLSFPNPAHAEIATTGDVAPADPATWTLYTYAHIGKTGIGTMSITSGSDVNDHDGYIGHDSGSMGEVTVDGTGSTWINQRVFVGLYGNDTLNITGGGAVLNRAGLIGDGPGTTGKVTVDGTWSTWTNSVNLYVGYQGSGVLNITGGGAVNSDDGCIGYSSDSTGEVTVDGTGSTWTNSVDLYVGRTGSGVLNIIDGGLASVGGTLTIDYDSDGDGFIGMGSGGMLALYGDADDLLSSFLGLIDGTDAIFYWDDSALNWADITGAAYGEDYTLSYLTEGVLAGYTMLTVDALIPDFLEGDANNDGLASADDYASVQENFGNTGLAGILGDANLDGAVSADDYASVQSNFGATAGMGSATVPEPASAGLLLLGLSGLLRRRMKR